MRTRFRLGLLVVAVVAAVFVAGYAVAGSITPASFVTSGTTRYAMVSRGPTTTTTTTSTAFVDIAGMSTAVDIPSGKTAELIITFSAMVNTCSAMYVRAVVDGSAASPSYSSDLWDFSGGADSHAFTFYKTVKEGSHTVAMQWEGLDSCAQQFMASRSMIVTANIH
jgi:hypothetical protein